MRVFSVNTLSTIIIPIIKISLKNTAKQRKEKKEKSVVYLYKKSTTKRKQQLQQY